MSSKIITMGLYGMYLHTVRKKVFARFKRNEFGTFINRYQK